MGVRKKYMSDANLKKFINMHFKKLKGSGDSYYNNIRDAVYLNQFDITKIGNDFALKLADGPLFFFRTRGEALAIRNSLIKDFQRNIKLVRQDLHQDWSEHVRARDNHTCLRCGSRSYLQAHHWCAVASRSRMAHFAYENGATVCNGCHNQVYTKLCDYLEIEKLYDAVQAKYNYNIVAKIKDTIASEFNNSVIRKLWYDRIKLKEEKWI